MSLKVDILVRRGEFVLEVAFAVEPASTLAIVGPNGAGKSTLVEALCGLLPIERGEVVLGGTVLERVADDVRMSPQRRSVAVLFQGLALFPRMSVRDNVAYGPRSLGRSTQDARRQADELLERFGLTALGVRTPSDLSGDEAQRVALARALAVKPALLLLDEPFSALDVGVRDAARSLLQEMLPGFGGVTLLVSHDAGDVAALASNTMTIAGGKLDDGAPG